jgi:hypothetical protein
MGSLGCRHGGTLLLLTQPSVEQLGRRHGYKENRSRGREARAIGNRPSLQQISNQLSKPVGAASVDCDFGCIGQGHGGLATQPAKQRLAFSLHPVLLSSDPLAPSSLLQSPEFDAGAAGQTRSD